MATGTGPAAGRLRAPWRGPGGRRNPASVRLASEQALAGPGTRSGAVRIEVSEPPLRRSHPIPRPSRRGEGPGESPAEGPDRPAQGTENGWTNSCGGSRLETRRSKRGYNWVGKRPTHGHDSAQHDGSAASVQARRPFPSFLPSLAAHRWVSGSWPGFCSPRCWPDCRCCCPPQPRLR